MQNTVPVTLRAENLVKKFGRRTVVNNASFSVQQGQVVGLLGPNGAGKTTSFYLAVGLIKADDGKISLESDVITKLPIHRRAKKGIGYLPQESSIFRSLTVWQNLMAVLELNKQLSRAQRKDKAKALLQDFQIEHIQSQLGSSLSGGERRRVEIARTLALDPKFVLLDEPFAGVDPVSVQDIQAMIRSLSQKGIGILITDHNVRETLGICDHAYILNNGEVIAEGQAAELVSNPLVKKVYLGENFNL
jgi:lipopolysaccharide export system ATP-binding protein